MVVIGVLIFFLLVLFLVQVVWVKQKKLCKFNNIPEKIDVLNLGSTYAFYDFDYEDKYCGFNSAVVPQYLYYDYIILKKYSKRLSLNGKVLIILPNFVFAVDGKKKVNDLYYEFLLPNEVYQWDWKRYVKLRWQAVSEIFTHKMEKQRNRWKGYTASGEEKEKHADKRIQDWMKNIGIPDMQSGEILPEVRLIINENIEILIQMIQYCISCQIEPIIVIPPLSKAMNDKISDDCLNSYLRSPIETALGKIDKVIKVLDYQKCEDFQSMTFYLNSDCLNKEGRKLFTDRVMKDIGVIKKCQ